MLQRVIVMACLGLTLVGVGCFSGQLPPLPVPAGVCMGDINGDGIVTIDEATVIAVGRSGEGLSDEALAVSDRDGDGAVSDMEFYQVIQNQASRRCVYVK